MPQVTPLNWVFQTFPSSFGLTRCLHFSKPIHTADTERFYMLISFSENDAKKERKKLKALFSDESVSTTLFKSVCFTLSWSRWEPKHKHQAELQSVKI